MALLSSCTHAAKRNNANILLIGSTSLLVFHFNYVQFHRETVVLLYSYQRPAIYFMAIFCETREDIYTFYKALSDYKILMEYILYLPIYCGFFYNQKF